MKAVIQRVTSASVTVADEVVGELNSSGLLVLLGVTHSDGDAEVEAMARKITGLRILPGERSVRDVEGAGILVVSQFTLYGDTRKGRRPSWGEAAPAQLAEPIVEAVVARLKEHGVPVSTGRFGADMQVALVNDGPFTVVVEL